MVAIGTTRGSVYLVDRTTNQLIRKYTPHQKKVTHIHIKEAAATGTGLQVVTSSNDGTLAVYSFERHEVIKRLDMANYEINCFTVIDPKASEFVLGFGTGDLKHYKESLNFLGQVQKSNRLLRNDKEGSVTLVKFYNKILLWATSTKIRLKYYSNGLGDEQSGNTVCYISCEDLTLPGHLTKNQALIPSVAFQHSVQQTYNPHPRNLTMVTTWYNMIKINELIYSPKEDRYYAHSIAKHTIYQQNVFLASSSFLSLNAGKEFCHITVQFDTEPGKKTYPQIALTKFSDLQDYVKSPEQILQ